MNRSESGRVYPNSPGPASTPSFTNISGKYLFSKGFASRKDLQKRVYLLPYSEPSSSVVQYFGKGIPNNSQSYPQVVEKIVEKFSKHLQIPLLSV
jgi:hypothetical protein